MERRKGGFRYKHSESNDAYYTHLLNGWQGVVTIYQENHLLGRLNENNYYQFYHPTKWTLPLSLYQSYSRSEDKKAALSKAIVDVLFDLAIKGESIELIKDTLMLRAVKCPLKKNFKRENNFHLSYKSAATFPGRRALLEYYREGNKCHFYQMNKKLGNIINSGEKTYPDMLGYNGRVHSIIKSLK
jgi:hypothetical protein